MADNGAPPSHEHLTRTLGDVRGPVAGPTLVAVAGIHGNEPAGLAAARRVLARLDALRGLVRGRFVALAGNVKALRDGVRYHARDLNRGWTDARMERLRAGVDASLDDAEDDEQRALTAHLEEALRASTRGVYLADLHTTSASGVPFVIFGDSLRQRRFVREIPAPLVLGLEEQIDGSLAEYWARRGVVSFAIEGGQHTDDTSVDSLAATLWIALESSGVLGRNACPEIAAARSLLDARRGSLPRVMEVLARHAITDDDRFVMEPGFANLAPVAKGTLLARDRRGEIRAAHDGVVMLPLYQPQGSDGFFWGRALDDGDLALSEALRVAGVARLLAWVPGVRAEGDDGLSLAGAVGSRVPRGLLRMLGFRRERACDGAVRVRRQPG